MLSWRRLSRRRKQGDARFVVKTAVMIAVVAGCSEELRRVDALHRSVAGRPELMPGDFSRWIGHIAAGEGRTAVARHHQGAP